MDNSKIYLYGKEVVTPYYLNEALADAVSKEYVDNKAAESTTAYYYRWDGSTGAEAKAMFSEIVKLAKANKVIHVYVDQNQSPYKLRRYTGTITNGSFDTGSSGKRVSFNMYQLDRARTSKADGVSYYVNKEVSITLEYDENYDVISISSYDNTNYSLTPDSHVVSKTYLTEQISKAIGSVSSFSLLPVDVLPTENIQTNVIYAVPSDDPKEKDVRIEYIYINNDWEIIGTTKIDLSNYCTKDDLANIDIPESAQNIKDGTKTGALKSVGSTESSGLNSIALGLNNTATGNASVALGSYNEVTAPGAIALGSYNYVEGSDGVALGGDNSISGRYAIAEGLYNMADADYTHAEG